MARIDELFAEIAEGEAALQGARQGLETWRRALLKAAVTGELTRDWREANRPAETGADRGACQPSASPRSRISSISSACASSSGRSPKLPLPQAPQPLP